MLGKERLERRVFRWLPEHLQGRCRCDVAWQFFPDTSCGKTRSPVQNGLGCIGCSFTRTRQVLVSAYHFLTCSSPHSSMTTTLFHLTGTVRLRTVCPSTVGMQACPVSGATIWNDLPFHIISAPSLMVFKLLETYLFFCSYQDCHMSRVLLLPFITTVWTPVVLAIINMI